MPFGFSYLEITVMCTTTINTQAVTSTQDRMDITITTAKNY